MIGSTIRYKMWKPEHGKYIEWREARSTGTFRCREYWNGEYWEKNITGDLKKAFWERLKEAMK